MGEVGSPNGKTTDEVPFSQDMDEGPKSPRRSDTSSKVQAMAYVVGKSQMEASGLHDQNVPGFVHLISQATFWLKTVIFTFLDS